MQPTLRARRQESAESPGRFKTDQARDVSPDVSFLDMLGEVSGAPVESGEVPAAFDRACREGTCGMGAAMITGVSHGPGRGRRHAGRTCDRSKTGTR